MMTVDNESEGRSEDGLDVHQYLSLFWHWSWLIVLVGVIAAGAAFFFSKQMTPYYEASTTVLVNEAPATKTTDYSSVMMSEQLTSTYAQMMAKDPVLMQVIGQLGLNMSTEELGKLITITPVRDTQLIAVTVETTEAQLSANIANAVATIFSAQIQEIQSQRFAQSKSTLEAQLAEIEKEIATYQTQAEEASTADERERLDAKVTQYREIYSGILQS
jgi:non-specific protein-tyrosine kinase